MTNIEVRKLQGIILSIPRVFNALLVLTPFNWTSPCKRIELLHVRVTSRDYNRWRW